MHCIVGQSVISLSVKAKWGRDLHLYCSDISLLVNLVIINHLEGGVYLPQKEGE